MSASYIPAVRAPFRVTASIVFAAALCMVSSSGKIPLAQGQTHHGSSFLDGNVRIGVMGLFHTQEFWVSAIDGQGLALVAGEEHEILETSSGVDAAAIRLVDERVALTVGQRHFDAHSVLITGRGNQPTDFVLAIPGKISRRYHGTVEIQPSGGALQAIVTLDEDTAVASVVAAESAPDSPLEALKAQAVAVRSYFVSGRGRHREFDFCDTTHCQFLRNPPPKNSPAARAVDATRGLVLAYNSHLFPAMYTRSCSGQTRTPAQLGLHSTTYPYYPVSCDYCRAHPLRWTTRISTPDAALPHSSDESSRLNTGRRLGWSTVPSNDFVQENAGAQVILEGIGNGHGIGLCQSGAKAMAENGATFREILGHYYPNTTIVPFVPTQMKRGEL